MLKKIIVLLAISFYITNANASLNNKVFKVYINQLVQHPALDATTSGIVDGLKEAKYINGKNLDLKIEMAQGDMSLASQISARFLSKSPDIVVGVATLSAQSLLKYAKEGKTKLVFSTVTDPIKAGLVNNIQKPGGEVTGVSNFIALEPQIEMFLKIKPTIKKLGFLYSSGELNSISLLEKIKETCAKYNIDVIGMTANKTSEVAQVAIKLSSIVDAIFISNDNTSLSAFRSIVKAANEQNVPVFVSDTDIVSEGAIAALGPNQYEVGKQTGKIIASILDGKTIGDISVEFPQKTELFLNKTVAGTLGIVLPEELIKKADKLF